MSGDAAIETRGLAKRYGSVRAVDGIDLDVRRGEVYAFLGRNGAGKTTTIRMLLGLAKPTAGDVRVLGAPLVPSGPAFGRVGSLVESASAYPNLTVRENLEIQRRLTRAPAGAVTDAIRLLGLEAYADRRARALSLGNKRRLSLARALLHAPELVILDEPANALDPAGIIEIRELLRGLADEHGVTVFLSSHLLAEVAHLADRMGVIHEGRMVAQLDREQLRERTRGHLTVVASDRERAREAILRLGITPEDAPDGELRVTGAADRAEEVAAAVVGAGVGLRRLTAEDEDLEAFFMRLTGGGA